MSPDKQSYEKPQLIEITSESIAQSVRDHGTAYVMSKLTDQLFTNQWTETKSNSNDNAYDKRGGINFTLPKGSISEPLASVEEHLDSHGSLKTTGKNQLILSAPVDSSHVSNLTFKKFNGSYQEIVIKLETLGTGFTTVKRGNGTSTSRFKLFLPTKEAQKAYFFLVMALPNKFSI